MEYIEEVLAKCKKDDKAIVIGVILAVVFFFGTIPIIIFFNGTKLVGLMFFLGVFFLPIIGFVLGMKLGKMLFKLKKVKIKW